jgi:hypothetical protein
MKNKNTICGLLESVAGVDSERFTLEDLYSYQAETLESRGDSLTAENKRLAAMMQRELYREINPHENFSILLPDRIRKDTIKKVIEYHFLADGYAKDSEPWINRRQMYFFSNNSGDTIRVQMLSIKRRIFVTVSSYSSSQALSA